MIMKYAYIDQFDTVPHKGKNLGDYVQTLAAKQFLPQSAIPINREHLDEYRGEKVKMIMASWFMSEPNHFPYSEDIEPLFISSHYTERSLEEALKRKESLDYFKKYQPIGCRDAYTVKVFEKYGIDAYFSGCLTLTLGKSFKKTKDSGEILMVDVMYEYKTIKEILRDLYFSPREIISRCIREKGFLKNLLTNTSKKKRMLYKFFSDKVLSEAKFITQLQVHTKEDDYLGITRDYLQRLCNAKFVITSRIHCALPCLAMGTPVLFIDCDLNQSRLEGLKDLFNTISIKGNDISFNFDVNGKIGCDMENPKRFEYYRDLLVTKVNDFLK